MLVAPKSCIVEVDARNFEIVWPNLQNDMRNATFMSLDTEMSGLGSNSHIFQSNADDRYKALRLAAETRSLISIGISCFKYIGNNEMNETDCTETSNMISYHANVYNILLLCDDSFTIDPSAVSFLVKHGFNFNLQFSKGLKYKKGDFNPKKSRSDDSHSSARKIFNEIIRVRKPIVFHNGFADLVFLYQCFYASCPKKLSVFLADVSEMFPSGIYDTKVIVHLLEKFNSSFLEYVCKSYQTLNHRRSAKSKPHILLTLGENNSSIEEFIGLVPSIESEAKDFKVCLNFAKYGWCKNNEKCNLSHNISDIIAQELIGKRKKSKKRKQSNESSDADDSTPCNGQSDTKTMKMNVEEQTLNLEDKTVDEKHTQGTVCHRAGLDSLLTGYSFAVFTAIHSTNEQKHNESESLTPSTFSSILPHLCDSFKSSIKNKVYLNGKNNTLWITKSHFSKTSQSHEDNILRIFLE
ncbi:target of EGR1 protein 1-like [Styela clava]